MPWSLVLAGGRSSVCCEVLVKGLGLERVVVLDERRCGDERPQL